MKGKKSVLLYCDIIHTVEKLDDETAGQLFKHYLRYINDLNPEAPNLMVEIAFEPIKQNLKRDLKSWLNKTETRSKSGIIGNLKRYNPEVYQDFIDEKITLEEAQELAKSRKESQKVANLADNDNVNVIVKETVKVKDNKKSIEEREADFKKILTPYLDIYGKDMLNKFFLYWTEKKPKGRKMRFEMEKVFDVERRLKTWSDRNFNNNKNGNDAQSNRKSRIDKFIGE